MNEAYLQDVVPLGIHKLQTVRTRIITHRPIQSISRKFDWAFPRGGSLGIFDST